MAKSKKITGAAVVAAPISTEILTSGKVWIMLFSNNNEYEVSAQLAKTLIKKNAAKLK